MYLFSHDAAAAAAAAGAASRNGRRRWWCAEQVVDAIAKRSHAKHTKKHSIRIKHRAGAAGLTDAQVYYAAHLYPSELLTV
jgi:hypothetical protein